MGKINLTALRVRQTALSQYASKKIQRLPQWVDVVGDIPPAETVIRTPAPQHQLVRQRLKTLPGSSKPQVVFEVQEKPRKAKKASRLFQPVELKYEEDELRKEFFRDHPWELARPRVLLESTGKDFENYDWSRIQQPGKRLDGERYAIYICRLPYWAHLTLASLSRNTNSCSSTSVVQRQLWLLHNVPDISRSAAYDIARREFYKLRLREDIERRVAAEEAEATGAKFGPSYLEIGMELENQQYEKWKAWAKTEAQILDSRAAALSGAPEIASEAEAEPDSLVAPVEQQ